MERSRPRHSDPEISVPSWTFLTNHAHVLVAISRDPDLRQRDIAHVVGITPGAVVKILNDLEEAGIVTAERLGRRNRYHVNGSVQLRHPLEATHCVDELIEPLRST
ncbi:MAG: winged helix-turn-helix domain-containing protein [Actinomycetota bacterium]